MLKIDTGDAAVALPALRGLQKGQRMVYHTGFLAVDRSKFDDQKSKMLAEAIGFIAKSALKLAEEGRVFLTQRKLGAHVYEYIATGA